MSQKTFYILFLILLLIVAGFFFAAFLLARKENRPVGEVLRDVAPFGELLQDIQFGGGRPLGEVGTGEPTLPETGISPEKLPDLYKISAEPVSGATAFLRDGTVYVRYALLETGHIYEYGATTTERTRLTNTTTLGTKELFWGKNGEMALIRYLDEENIIKTFLARVLLAGNEERGASSGLLYGDFLPDNINEMAVSPDGDQFFYLLSSGNTANGFISDFEKKEKKEKNVFIFPFTEWLVSWPKKSTLILTTRPSASADGFAYAMDAATGALKKIIGGVRGLTTKPSPDMANVLYSRGLQNRVDAFLLNIKTGAVENFPVSTFSEKCAWGMKNPRVVYCGVPEILPQGSFPDDWYQGKISFSDALWQINMETSVPKKLSLPETDAEEAVDVTEPFLSPNDDFLFFINKKDSSLWSLRI